VIAFAVLLTISQLIYGTAMGYGYLPALFTAAAGGDGFGSFGLMWHENVSLRGVVLKAFGYLEKPDFTIIDPPYALGFYVRYLPQLVPWARAAALVAQALGVLWVGVTLLRRTSLNEPSRTYWDWALVGIMMLVLAPQISQDYMVLTLGAFSFVLAGCMLYGTTATWIQFGIAVLLVGNVVPRGVFSRFVLIDAWVAINDYGHLTRSEAYQYFGFPLLGLLVLALAWTRLSSNAGRPVAA
jgi:hypothetical protein